MYCPFFLRIRPLVLFPALFPAVAEAQTVFWEHKAVGQTVYTCGEVDVRASDNQNWRQNRVTVTDPCGLTGTFNRDESNWSTGTAPDSPAVNVALAGSTPVTFLGNDTDVSTLTIADTNELRIRSLGILRVFGGMIQNDGFLSSTTTAPAWPRWRSTPTPSFRATACCALIATTTTSSPPLTRPSP